MAKWDLGKLDSKADPVNKPVHYNQAGIECIDAIEAMTENMSGSIAPHAANVLKYMWRCEYKNGLITYSADGIYLYFTKIHS